MTRRKTQEEFETDIREKYGEGYIVTTEYKRLTSKVGFKHECGHEWKINPKTAYGYTREILCPKCNQEERSTELYYKRFYDKYDRREFEIKEGTFTKTRDNVEVIHTRCGTVTVRRAGDYLEKFYNKGNICKTCLVNKNESSIREMISVHINHEEFEIISGNREKYKLKHKTCGEEFFKYFNRINNKENKIPCPRCVAKERVIKEQRIKEEKKRKQEYLTLRLNLEGKKFGYLTALEDVGVHGNTGWRSWKCVCECGEITYVASAMLRSGHTSSCGCYGRDVKDVEINNKIYKRLDLRGKRYGKLTVIEVDKHDINTGNTTWKCICDCGEIKIATQQVLLSGKTNSCGCLRRLDITGEKFGKLTAMRFDEEKFEETGDTYWECLCECGNTKTVKTVNLTTRATSSCGCASMSSGELYIKKTLDRYGITYEMEYTFDDLRSINLLRFDFAIFNDSGEIKELVEFDGWHHFYEVPHYTSTLEGIQHRDNLKNTYCEKNNIPLTRIPYTEIHNVEEIIKSVLFKHGLI